MRTEMNRKQTLDFPYTEKEVSDITLFVVSLNQYLLYYLHDKAKNHPVPYASAPVHPAPHQHPVVHG
jgi:hypothetical protein